MARKLPIEPLDNARWDRIERSLDQRLERKPIASRSTAARSSTQRLTLALAGVAAAAAVSVVLWDASRPTAKPMTVAMTSVTHVETQGTPSHVDVGSSSLDVAAHSSARIEGNDEAGVLVALDHGSVECEVAPRRGRPPFVVRAGDVSVRVVGTHFRVERNEEATQVTVQRGAVEVESHGTTTVVRAGASWPLTSEVAAPVATQIISAPIPATSATKLPNVGVATTAILPSPRERYDRALALEASRPDEALAIYRELASGQGAWAMNALYAEGRFELERGNNDIARALFSEYLRRYPAGANANDARDLAAKLQ